MRIFNNLNDLPKFHNAVVTIGSFDGVHSGHQKILQKINSLAKYNDGESIVITFHPHPRLILYPNDSSLQLITTIDEKVKLLERYGVDNVIVVPFTKEFSQQSADAYIQNFLVEKCHPKHIVIGYDHRFGLNRTGDINYLKQHGERFDYEVLEIQKQEIESIAVSSTKVRNSLITGEVNQARKLLGHYFTLTGLVVHGQHIGSTIGYPTANLEITQKHKLIPPDGIYAVYVLHKEHRYKGMLYIGNRPSLEDNNKQSIEVNIFDFHKDIYNDKLTIEFVSFVRSDRIFEGLEGLKEQLANDKIKSLEILKDKDREEERQKEMAIPKPSVAAVILNYNGIDFLKQFLHKVSLNSYPNFKVYLADNGSKDKSIEWVNKELPNVQIIDLQSNSGFAEGYNRALQQVNSDYYILLNSDVEVPENWVSSVIEKMEADPTIAAAQPKIKAYQNKDKFEYAGAAGGWIDKWGYPFSRGRIFSTIEKDTGQYDTDEEIFWASGAALFIRAELYHKIGGLDGDYFAHMEEIDMCWRLKRAGFKIMSITDSEVYHVGGGTLDYLSPNKTFLNFRNSYYTIVKNMPASKLLWLIPLRLVLDAVAGGLFLTQGKFSHIKAIVRAHWTFFPKIPYLLKRRKHFNDLIQQISISDKPNKTGILPKSIIWQYYGRGKKYFWKMRG